MMGTHDQRLLAALLRADFYSFARKAFATVNPGEAFLPNWHLEALCHHLELVRTGQVRRLRIEVPPRSLKSVCASVAFPAFVLGHDPGAKIISVSYSGDLAAKHAGDCRAVLLADWYRALFPHTRLSATRNQESNYETTARGYRYATSVGGTLTGRGGNLIIIDDPLKPEDAMSAARREAVNGWYSRTLLSRLNNKSKDAIILVQQRLHLDDLAGYVEDLDEWVTLTLPAIAPEDTLIPIGPGRTYLRRAGEVLHPAREPQAVLEALRRSLGSTTFSAQYQQCPVPADGEVVKWAWFRRYTEVPARSAMTICQSWDTATKPDEHHDYSVCTTWGISGNNLYLLDVDRARLDFPSLKRRVVELARRWEARTLLIEDKGSGTALIQQLRSEANGICYPTAFVPKDDKLTRLHAQSAWIEAGHVWLPERAPWLEELRTEFAAFPQGRHDDQVDAISQFLAWHFERRQRVARVIKLGGV
jgi:predicted phage terminase large subunit-like protein